MDCRIVGIGDVERSELVFGDVAKRHVFPVDLPLRSVWKNNGVCVYVGVHGEVLKLDVIELGSPNDFLLFLDGQRVPRNHVVKVLLGDDVAAAGVRGVIVTDEHGRCRVLAFGVLGPVHETKQVPLIKELERVEFELVVDFAFQRDCDLLSHLETDVDV